MEDILEVIVSRRSVKSFKPDMVEKEKIDKVLKAGICAPSGKNQQSSIIIAVTNKMVRDKLSNLCSQVRGGLSVDPFYNAPVVLVVLSNKNVFTHVYDGSCVLENMLLEAHSIGLGACWIHHAKEMFDTIEGKEILTSLGINADEYEGVGSCVLGYSNTIPHGEIKRKDNYVYYVE